MNEAELVLTDILGCDRMSLYTRKKSRLSRGEALALCSIFKRRLRGEPLQYILGKTEFMGLEFKVNPSVLIPRPETEILVESVVKYVTTSQRHNVTRILDMCTGSGCIAISLAKNLKRCRIDAVDISAKALQVARDNASRHNVDIGFIRSDLFDSSFLRKGSYDILVCNPPYVAQGEFSRLQPEVAHEPVQALYGGRDGLDFFRALASLSGAYLGRAGLLFAEMGYGQSGRVQKIFKGSGPFDIIEIIRDYAGIERIIVVKKKESYG